jgi:hypothetical protein
MTLSSADCSSSAEDCTRTRPIQAGKLADLLVVNRDPRTDLRHLRDIAYVIKARGVV